MIRWIIFGLLALVVLILVMVLRMPLGFVLDRANLPAGSVSYSAAEGTIWNGRLNGLEVAGQPIGDVTLSARPQDLLAGGLSYDLQWGGPGGRGVTQITLGFGGSVSLQETRLEQSIGSVEGLMNAIREFGGVVRLRDGAIKLRQDQCESAAGTISSDILTNIGQSYGRAFGPVDGRLSCEDGVIVIYLVSTSETGDRVDVQSRLWLSGRADVTAEVATNDVELGAALAELYFEQDGDVWRYSRIEGMGGQR